VSHIYCKRWIKVEQGGKVEPHWITYKNYTVTGGKGGANTAKGGTRWSHTGTTNKNYTTKGGKGGKRWRPTGIKYKIILQKMEQGKPLFFGSVLPQYHFHHCWLHCIVVVLLWCAVAYILWQYCHSRIGYYSTSQPHNG